MIRLEEQIKRLRSKLNGGKAQYVIVPTINGGKVVMGITTGKRFDFAMYRDNMIFRRG